MESLETEQQKELYNTAFSVVSLSPLEKSIVGTLHILKQETLANLQKLHKDTAPFDFVSAVASLAEKRMVTQTESLVVLAPSFDQTLSELLVSVFLSHSSLFALGEASHERYVSKALAIWNGFLAETFGLSNEATPFQTHKQTVRKKTGCDFSFGSVICARLSQEKAVLLETIAHQLRLVLCLLKRVFVEQFQNDFSESAFDALVVAVALAKPKTAIRFAAFFPQTPIVAAVSNVFLYLCFIVPTSEGTFRNTGLLSQLLFGTTSVRCVIVEKSAKVYLITQAPLVELVLRDLLTEPTVEKVELKNKTAAAMLSGTLDQEGVNHFYTTYKVGAVCLVNYLEAVSVYPLPLNIKKNLSLWNVIRKT